MYGQVWASLVNEKIGTNISTQQTSGTEQNIILTDSKQTDSHDDEGVARQAWEGKGDWTKGSSIATSAPCFPCTNTPFHFVALEKRESSQSGISRANARASDLVTGTCGTYFPIFFKTLGVDTDHTQRSGVGHGCDTCRRSDRRVPILRGRTYALRIPSSKTNKVRFFTFLRTSSQRSKLRCPSFRTRPSREGLQAAE